MEKFLSELKEQLSTFEVTDVNQSYDNLTDIIRTSLDKFVPLKSKKLRGNQARFMNKELGKAIMMRSKLKKRYNKNKNLPNRLNFKKQRNVCVKLRIQAINKYFQSATSNMKQTSIQFYSLIKPYMTNKGALSNDDIILKEGDIYINDDRKIAEIFNNYYINIVKLTTGKHPESIADTLSPGANYNEIIGAIIDNYKSHASVQKINAHFTQCSSFTFQIVSVEDVKEILKSLDIKKATGIDQIPPKIIKASLVILATPLTKLINKSILENTFHPKPFTFQLLSEEDVRDILKSLDIKKATGVDQIPPEIIKESLAIWQAPHKID